MEIPGEFPEVRSSAPDLTKEFQIIIRNVIVVCLAVVSFLPSLQGSQVEPKSLLPILAHAMKTVPFSFIYANQSSEQILTRWKRSETKKVLPDERVQTITSYTDPVTGLEVTWEATEFAPLGAVEWVVRLRNTGSRDTPIIEKLLALDQNISVPAGTVVFHHVLGSAGRTLASDTPGMTSDYRRIDQRMDVGTDCHLVHFGMKEGIHVETDLPYFNAQWEDGGLIGGIGWTGQWELTARHHADALSITVGQEMTHFKLHPGESVRTPSVVLLEWKGKDWLQSQNLWRHLLVAYYLPRVGGEVMTPIVTHTPNFTLMFDDIAAKTGRNPLDVWPSLKTGDALFQQSASLNYVNEKNQLELLNRLPDVGLEGYWVDAGWFIGGWPSGAGNWDPDPKFPRGLRPIGDAAHKRRLNFILWFEPQRVSPGTMVAKQHPEWVLQLPDNVKTEEWAKDDGQFNFGIPAARQWMTDMLSQHIEDWGIDTYRNDNNQNPLPFWRAADAPDRMGITENHDIEGFYAFWDGLLQKHPKLTIDNANWRITGQDIEVTRRSIGSLTRTELDGYEYFPEVNQSQTMELSLWVPLHASLLNALDPYRVRSVATTGVGIGLDLLSPYISQEELRKAVAEIKQNRPYWLGDFYPLAGFNTQDKEWCVWQFHRSDLGAGYTLFFRRPKSVQSSMAVSLHGLDSAGKYEVTFAETYDVMDHRIMTGNDLTKLRVSLSSAASSMLVRYRRIEGPR
jgi:alpha-galactosidase